ncbi:MAG: hypothetical protein AAGA92_01600 [Planctomycetota bacterium]
MSTQDLPHPTRFGLRSAAVAATLLAFVFAAVGAYYRSLQTELQPVWLAYCGGFLTVLPPLYILWVAYCDRGARKVGAVEFSLPVFPNAKPLTPRKRVLLHAAEFALVAVYFIAFWALATYLGPLTNWPFHLVPLLLGAATGLILVLVTITDQLYRARSHCTLIGEHGICSIPVFIPWRRIDRVEKGELFKNTRQAKLTKGKLITPPSMLLWVPEGKAEPIDAYIAQRLAETHSDNPAETNPT